MNPTRVRQDDMDPNPTRVRRQDAVDIDKRVSWTWKSRKRGMDQANMKKMLISQASHRYDLLDPRDEDCCGTSIITKLICLNQCTPSLFNMLMARLTDTRNRNLVLQVLC